ncbi:5'-methylthioadenosine/S-adenosylhomocysteine nucleosidase [Marinomonas sp. UCMA 3892]|jgi:adenosylhomocysteine nucleosidase|uniref:5'-methylthioadenosine/S-adenosylhomocysteine nucleosidase n=1 Tax=Marinomonas sp. (strain MWYL1) TaxID=400668 RepID=MTNN_MARMS|nr:5'-methylthioadenosine/S-adenosylhomocysteine nucleosidase [Marinomonas sp. UCMA 3892]A6W3C9.1 RecName: Full=5'-methylthioadenosine/S-adenosylhomocysteine nucleosidase; Short=MTA/SAH nucleosidase; Short=MTAN; AltName: Full=5'-deoxyadenosine nucleosidase; Short=DOA nucleosidase; Short=dAdo nucleosidase; AltName: Full=5'-methylthioadenosine nucleosidase; Short=MTA nucleosidase; AltName: Full=S-adenosylhomocysteine nucleosidase; Short=AdoHcy nucleosidase; Short=SAH nucleosidase; Short=SRH nucleosi
MSVIGLIGAMDEEVAVIKAWMTDVREQTIAGCDFFVGRFEGKDVVLLKSGIGKVNAAVSTTLLLSQFEPEYVINIGSAGGFDPELQVGDVVISDQVVHHDVDVTGFGYLMGQVPNMPATYAADETLVAEAKAALQKVTQVQAKVGLIGTGDSFMNDPVRVEAVRALFPELVAVEMEAAAVAQVCFKFGTPFVVVRSLSDIAGKESPQSFEEYLKVAAENSSLMIQQMLKGN